MPKEKLVGSSIVNSKRPNIRSLIGKDVIVIHTDSKHGTWEGELKVTYANDIEKAENFRYQVDGTPCGYCNKRCTEGKETGCEYWEADVERLMLDKYAHSSQPNLFFTANCIYKCVGNIITLG